MEDTTNKRLTRDVVDPEEEEKTHKKTRLLSDSDSDSDSDSESEEDDILPCYDLEPKQQNVYSELVFELRLLLPSCWLLWSQDWIQVLQNIGPNTQRYPTLWSDLASLCHWFLSIDAPEPFKKGAKEALQHIASKTSLATQMTTDHKSASYLLEHVLDSGYSLLIYQACCAIGFLCWWRGDNYSKDPSFSDGVVNKLFNLVEQDSLFLTHARRAICSIACVDERVKNKIIAKAKHDTRFKWPFLFGDTEEVEHTCMIVACIVGRGKRNDATWDDIEGFLISSIVEVMRKAGKADDIPVMVAAAYAISSATEFATHDQTEMLFFMDCLEVLYGNIGRKSPALTNHILDGTHHMLYAGHKQGNTMYVDWIEDDLKSPGWGAIWDVEDKSLCFPCSESEALHSIEYKAYYIAYVYGGHPWIFEKYKQKVYPFQWSSKAW